MVFFVALNCGARKARCKFCDWVCGGETFFSIVFGFGGFCRVCGALSAQRDVGFVILRGMVNFAFLVWFVCWSVLLVFVLGEARRGVWNFGVCGVKWTPALALAP